MVPQDPEDLLEHRVPREKLGLRDLKEMRESREKKAPWVLQELQAQQGRMAWMVLSELQGHRGQQGHQDQNVSTKIFAVIVTVQKPLTR